MKTLPIINGKSIDIDDMAAASDINEVDLLYNLLNRLKIKKTFTNVGPTLLIVNPFTRIEGVYGEEQIDQYLKKQEEEPPELRQKITNPHLYDLVLIAIKELLKSSSKNQALVISGESGAGKTEATKNSMKCITYYFQKFATKTAADGDIPLETKILNCNPILEAFGNAKTVRNDNSSRFGKYVKIKLNSVTNVIEGAEMSTYLLEKSRISELNDKERNYHVFYFLLKCEDEQLLSSLYLNSDIKSYKYLYTSEHQVMEVPSIDDKACFIELTDCFRSTGFTDDDITNIFKIVAAVLLLGNVRMKIAGDKCIVENIDLFQNICSLLGVDPEVLQTVLSRKPPMPGRTEYGGVYSQAQVKSYVDALAKELYNRLFLWIVTKLNFKLDSQTQEQTKYIGLLDIFGFECFDKNSLEQLCINYTNEQLQQLYIKDIFENDKTEFRKEGLESKLHLLDATYKDNKDIIRLIKIFFNRIRDAKEDKQIYDIVVNFQKDIDKPPKSEKTFSKIKVNHFKTNKFKQDIFMVEHTAKEVTYSVQNFVEKNKDETKAGVVDCILASTNQTIQQIFTNTTNAQACEEEKQQIIKDRTSIDNNKIKNRFLGMKFAGEMKKLKTELKQCDHHYVRCLKPNEEKKALLFHPNFVFNQIQYLGILATIQVRKSGYPSRYLYKDFYENYKIVLSEQKITAESTHEEYIEAIKKIIVELVGEEEAKKNEDECLFGKTKIYLKQRFNSVLEFQKAEKLKIKIQSSKLLQIGTVYLRKQKKADNIKKHIEDLQQFFNANRSKIHLQKKKEKIKVIQASYYTKIMKEKFQEKIEDMKTIQNSVRILLAKKRVEKMQNIYKFLSFQLQIYLRKIHQIHRVKMKKCAVDILQRIKEEIVFREYNNLWNKVNPFVFALLSRKKFKNISEESKKLAKRAKLNGAIMIFQYNLLIHKIQEKKERVKKIFCFSSSKMFSNYYFQMRKEVLIIQKYILRLLNKKAVFDKLNDKYFDDNERNLYTQKLNVYKELFPNWIGRKMEKTPSESDFSVNISTQTKGQEKSMLSRNTHDENTNISNNYNQYTYGKTEVDILRDRKRHTNSGYVNSVTGKKNPIVMGKKIPKPEYKNCIFPPFDVYQQPQINIFAKVVEIDTISDNSENADNPWTEQFMKVYRESMARENPIQVISLGNCHTMCLTSNGKIYSWGWNNYAQCGVAPNKTEIGYILPSLEKDSHGRYPPLPVLNCLKSGGTIDFSNITKISLSDDYSLLLNDKGTVLSLGNNNYGQLGLGYANGRRNGNIISRFEKNVQDIVTTENFNIILTKSNELYIWYLSKDDSLIKPTKIYLDKKITIENISAGKNFAIVLSKNGVCYAIGSNMRGELGLDDFNYFRVAPEEITKLTRFNERITQVRCGFKHVVCVGINGNVYGWGNNTYGQLGNNSKELKGIVRIPITDQSGAKEKIVQVAAGFRSSIFLTDKRDIYFCGIIGEENQSTKPKKFNIKEKTIEVGNELEFGVVRIMTTYSRTMSIFYVSIADVRSFNNKFQSKARTNEILNALAEKWTSDKTDGPFIPHISRFFSSQFMKVVKKKK